VVFLGDHGGHPFAAAAACATRTDILIFDQLAALMHGREAKISLRQIATNDQRIVPVFPHA
jgi:hypothetical protein